MIKENYPVSLMEHGVTANPQECLGKLQLLTAPEKEQLLVESNSTRTDYPQDKCIHQLFEEQVERTPDAVAVVFADEQLTYRELNAKANQVAHYLQKQGVGPEVLVGICVQRSLNMVIGLLGILKAGGAYVPIDITYPKERILYILQDTQAPILITESKISQLLEYQGKVVLLDDTEAILKESQQNLTTLVLPSNLLYVIYTSGSSGKPKGVMVAHFNVVRLFQSVQTYVHFDNKDRWTLFHSFSFGFSVWEIYGALLHGGRLIIVPRMVSLCPEAFYDLVCKHKVTILSQTPSAFRSFMKAEEADREEKNWHMRLIIFSGEPLKPNLLKLWIEKHGDNCPKLINMYAITEASGQVAYHHIKRKDLRENRHSLIGISLPDVPIYILNNQQKLLPRNVPGEMYIGGDAVARGYLNLPELTAEKFIPNPFSNKPDARLYKTGDLARYLPNGKIEFLGRVDNQIKMNGFRIELEEIEATLETHPVVEKTVVRIREYLSEQCLVAYLIPHNQQTISPQKLRSFLSQKLPSYMIPMAFVWLEDFPLLPNQKVDYQALPAPKQEDVIEEVSTNLSTQKIKNIIANIWFEYLGFEVSIHDNIFEAGGNSLQLIQVYQKIQMILPKYQVSMMDFFSYPNIGAFAKYLSNQR